MAYVPTATPLPERAFLTISEFAKLLGIGSTTAYEMAKRDALPIPVLRVGNQYRISKAAYLALVNAQHDGDSVAA
jgi:excisionase family DNA binding protein